MKFLLEAMEDLPKVKKKAASPRMRSDRLLT